MEKVNKDSLSKTELNLLEKARSAADNHLNLRTPRKVGAALLCADGSIYQGASVQRKTVSSPTCAERMALDRAIFDKKYDYQLLATIGFFDDYEPDEIISPCGLCRQILAEAENYTGTRKSIPILLASPDLSNIIRTSSSELFPIAYLGGKK